MSSTLKIDWKVVDKMLRAGCSGIECAAALGIHENTLYQHCKKDKELDFVAYKAQKRAAGNRLLREKQMELAEEGDKTMLIWLGKQRLEQREKYYSENIHKGETFTVNVVRGKKPKED